MSEHAVVALQKNASPQQTVRTSAINRQCGCGNHTVAGEECMECRKKRLAVQLWPAERAIATLASAPSTQASSFGFDLSRVRLRAGSSLLQAAPASDTAPIELATPAPAASEIAPEPAVPPSQVPELTPEIPSALEPATPAVPEAATTPEGAAPMSASFLVDDTATELAPGQMRKSDFLDQLRPAVCAEADAALAATGRSSAGCPYLDFWFDYYARQDAAHSERALQRYAPEATNVTSASDYIPIVAGRVRQGVERWAVTGEISGVPEGIPLSLPASPAPVQPLARPGGAHLPHQPQAIQSQLGQGQPLDGGLRARMESAFGTSFGYVRVHHDATANSLSDQVNARAFTVGQHVAFASGEYQPGTLLGDVLIAHELAHVVQQAGTQEAPAAMSLGDASYNALEADADQAAVGAIVSLWRGVKGGLTNVGQNAMPRLMSGLRLQRCATTTTATPASTVAPASQAGCHPTLQGQNWSVASAPILIPRNGRCDLLFAQSASRDGMEFTALVNIVPNCAGRVYFAQYVHPNSDFVNCFESRPLGLCTTHSWGIDTSWPYSNGSIINTNLTAGTEQRAIRTVDSPGQRNVSNQETSSVRLCLNNEFVTYIVFENASHTLTPLGWMEWRYNAQAWRDGGGCPPTHTSTDCTGWHVTGAGSKVGESFTPGQAHARVPLNRSAPVVTPLDFETRDCPDSQCPAPTTGSRSSQ